MEENKNKSDDLAKYILIAFGKMPLLEQRTPTENELRMLRSVLKGVGARFMAWLYNNNYMRPQNMTGTIKWDQIMEEFFRDEGLIRNTKCRVCKGIAYEIDPGKFHCSECGNLFDEDICPKCGKKMDGPMNPEEGETKFTPFWICSCGYSTEV